MYPSHEITYIDCLQVKEHSTNTIAEAHQLAIELLQGTHITEGAIENAMTLLKRIRFFYAWCYVSRCYNW